MPSRFLCNDVQREGVKPRPDLASWLFCYTPLHNIWYGISDWFDLQLVLGSSGTLQTSAPGICLHSCDGCWINWSYLECLRIVKVQSGTLPMGWAQTTRAAKEASRANYHPDQTAEFSAFASSSQGGYMLNHQLMILLANWFPKLKSGILCSSLQARFMISPTIS